MNSDAVMKSWWPQQILLGWLNLVLTAPIIYLYVGLPLVMRQQGWTGTEIGMLQMAGLPAILKFVLATPVDRWHLGKSSYRNWAMVLSLGCAATLMLLGAHDIRETSFTVLFILALLVSFLGTWADIPINGLAIRILPESERIRAGAIRSAATSIGSIVGGGFMLMLHTRFGWTWPFTVLALGMLSGVILIPLLSAGRASDRSADFKVASLQAPRAGLKEWLSWFSLSQHRVWSVLLILYFPLAGAIWVYLKPLMLDHGFAPDRIAMMIGVVGGLVATISSMAGSWISRRTGAALALPLFAAGNLLALILLTSVVFFEWRDSLLMASALVVALMMGASAGLVFGLMMCHTRKELSALDYGIQSSLFVIGRTVIPVLAGVLLDRLGYSGMLLCLAGGLALVLALVIFSRHRIYSAAMDRM